MRGPGLELKHLSSWAGPGYSDRHSLGLRVHLDRSADPDHEARFLRHAVHELFKIATRSGPGENVEWWLAMVDCMRDEGFVVVTEETE